MDKLIIDKGMKKSIAFILILVVVYIGLSFYFKNHFAFFTSINGVNVSCKNVEEAEKSIVNEISNYKIELQERDNLKEEITCDDIDLKCNFKGKITKLMSNENPFTWISSLVERRKYINKNIFTFNESMLKDKINSLICFSEENIIDPKNPSFEYTNQGYIIHDEIYGNKVKKDRLYENLKDQILEGTKFFDLESYQCYENPDYNINSKEVLAAKDLLYKYINSKIVYTFGDEMETVDSSIINEWLSVDNNMNVKFDKKKVKEYIDKLSEKYNTVGKERKFKTSSGKVIKISGGYYGWKINVSEEVNELINNIECGQRIVKEPLYSQRAVAHGDDDIGDTYVEVNITRQHLWFYKNGKVVVQGDVVTGNINRNNPTHLGVYELNYKQKGATLKGFGYSSDVTYWMPFNGNIGIHDANWRSSFGGNIYKNNGTHGCVNAPLYLAKTIFENIEAGTPIICYEEK